jgi:hypothetical protein
MIGPRWAVLAVIGVTVVTVAGCQSGTVTSGGSSTPPGSSSASISVAPPTSSAPISGPTAPPSTPVSSPPSSSSTASSSAAPSSTAPTSSTPTTPTSTAPAPPPALKSTCHSLMIRVIQGSGAPGYELDALDFVNTGNSSCVLVGVPTVTLLRGGTQVGTVSKPSSASSS